MVKRVSAPCAACGGHDAYRRLGRYRCAACGRRWRPTALDLRIEELEQRWAWLETCGRAVFFIGNAALIPFTLTLLVTLGRPGTALYVTAALAFAGFGLFVVAGVLIVIGRALRSGPKPELQRLYRQRQNAQAPVMGAPKSPDLVNKAAPTVSGFVLWIGRGSVHLALRLLGG